MDNGIFVIVLVFFGMIFIFWRGMKVKPNRTEESSKLNYRESWNNSGFKLKWWVLALNYAGTMVLLKQILSLRSLHGAGLAQGDMGVWFTYMIFVLIPSIFVLTCTIFFIRFEINAGNIKTKLPYLILAVVSIILPIVLLENISSFIG